MAATIPDLWPDDIRVDVLTPLAILRTQEALLGKRTKGLIQAEITTANSEKGTQHSLDLVTAALKYRERVLTAWHGREFIYPVRVAAETFKPKPKNFIEALTTTELTTLFEGSHVRTAATQDEFVALIREVFRSMEVRSLIQSLLARVNESQGTDEGLLNSSPPQVATESASPDESEPDGTTQGRESIPRAKDTQNGNKP